MVAISQSRMCFIWTRVVHPISTPWFGVSANVDPETLDGGISFGAGKVLTNPLYLTALGTGDGAVTVNTGGGTFFGDIPPGFTPGWPDENGLPDLFDPSTGQGSAVVSPLSVAFPNAAGCAQSFTGQDDGSFYLEYTFTGDLFTNLCGIGAARLMPGLAEIFNGGFAPGDPDGGAVTNTGFNNTWQASIAANNATTFLTPLSTPPGNVMGVAIAIVNQANFIPQPFFPMQLPPMSCCKAFGRVF